MPAAIDAASAARLIASGRSECRKANQPTRATPSASPLQQAHLVAEAHGAVLLHAAVEGEAAVEAAADPLEDLDVLLRKGETRRNLG